jgi:hypothetical protein
VCGEGEVKIVNSIRARNLLARQPQALKMAGKDIGLTPLESNSEIYVKLQRGGGGWWCVDAGPIKVWRAMKLRTIGQVRILTGELLNFRRESLSPSRWSAASGSVTAPPINTLLRVSWGVGGTSERASELETKSPRDIYSGTNCAKPRIYEASRLRPNSSSSRASRFIK